MSFFEVASSTVLFVVSWHMTWCSCTDVEGRAHEFS